MNSRAPAASGQPGTAVRAGAPLVIRVPGAVAALLVGGAEVGTRDQAFPFITVDDDGFPHAALLSRTELEVGPGNVDLRAALRSRHTRANLEARGRAVLIAVAGDTAHYVKLRLVRSVAVGDLLACVFELVEHKPDSLGVALEPIRYAVTAEIARAERWDATVAALGVLDDGTPGNSTLDEEVGQ